MAKNDNSNAKRKAFDLSHIRQDKPSIGLAQCGRNLVYSMSSAFNRTIKKLNKTKQHVSFATHNTVRLYKDHEEPLMITYNSGSNGNYLSEKDHVKAGLPILQAGLPILQSSTHMVGVANRGTSQAQHVTQLPFHKLSARARQADTFQDFLMLLMSVGKTSDDGTISVFTKTSITVFKEEDVLIHHMQGQAHPHWRARWKGTIPNTVDATTGTVATKAPIQTSVEGTTTGQQRL